MQWSGRKFKIWLKRNAFKASFYPAKIFTSDQKFMHHVKGGKERKRSSVHLPFTFLFFSSPVQLVCCTVSWMSIGEEMSRCWGKKGLTAKRLESYSGKTSHQGWKVIEAFFARSESHQLWGQLLRWGRPLGAKNHWWRKTLHHTTWKAQWIFLHKSVSKYSREHNKPHTKLCMK